jgi:prepilin-type N-terminal cleavage/methylation domain-containing protein
MTSAATRHYTQRGFSLIEVLIAVLVLSIGMLGLGAVFPAIIAEQRDAFEAIEGQNAAAAAEAMLSNPEFVDLRLLGDTFGKRDPLDTQYIYDWVVPQFGADFYGWTTPTPGYYVDFSTFNSQDFQGSESGTWSFNANQAAGPAANQQLTSIPVSARLFPQANSGKQPKYVWDVALRREPGQRVQAAIFVRRVDARIRIPRDSNLSNVLTGVEPGTSTVDEDYFRLPIAINRNNGLQVADQGRPEQVYAAIQMLEVEVYEDYPDELVFVSGPFVDGSINFAVRPGQQLVDNTGVVRTVVGPAQRPDTDPLPNNRVAVIVDPPFVVANAGGNDTDDVRPDVSPNGTVEERSRRSTWVRQVIFTPRSPVAVRIVNLEVDS